jgi:hypothetical protein
MAEWQSSIFREVSNDVDLIELGRTTCGDGGIPGRVLITREAASAFFLVIITVAVVTPL